MNGGTHGYICECLGPCRERIYLTRAAYAFLAEIGNVVSRWCTSPVPRRVLFVDGDALVVRRKA